MIKKTILILFCVFLLNCSFDSNSEFWNDKKKKIVKNNENTMKIENSKKINLDENLSFNQFKEKFIIYGKKSDFPNISE